MLIITRQVGESFVTDGTVEVVVLAVTAAEVRLGFRPRPDHPATVVGHGPFGPQTLGHVEDSLALGLPR